MRRRRLPLEGIRIFEPGIALAVPLASRLLADMGAEIVKLESAARPEIGRVTIFADNTPGEKYWEKGGFYAEANRNKHNVSIDLGTPEGKDVFRELVKISDVVMENFTPRVMANFGLSYPELKKIRPDIIVFSSTGFGQDGPWRNYRAYGFSLEPTTGISHFTGYPDGSPVRSIISYTDTPAAYVGAFAILAALEHRAKTGEGQWIDVSQYEVGAGFVAETALTRQLTGDNGGRQGNRDANYAPHGAYCCQGDDQWVTISVGSDADWRALALAIGRPDLVDDERFADVVSRKRNEALLDEPITAWTSQRSGREAMTVLQQHGVAAGLVMDSRELTFDPHLSARGFYASVEHDPSVPNLGIRPYVTSAWARGGDRMPIRRPPAMLGEHNEFVLTGLLGKTPAEIAHLAERGVTVNVPTGARTANRSFHTTLDDLRRLGVIRDYDTDYRARLGVDL